MSEPVLNALVRLFALISDIHDDTVITSREKNIVFSFLSRQLNNELANKYMKMFEEHLAALNAERITKDSIEDRKRTTVNAMKILAICEEINRELRQDQKIYVIVQLLDYTALGAEITANELDFLRTVSTSFFINQNDFRNIENFIMRGISVVPEKFRVLVIDNNTEVTVPGIKHRYCDHLSGDLSFLHIYSTDTFILRYTGRQDLYLNGINISTEKTYVFDRGSSLRGSGVRTIYHTDVAGMITGTSNDLGITIEAGNISFRFRNSDNGIQNLNFREESGTLVGIMGGSGVGKSTTLSMLSGTLRPQAGKVLINGYDIYDDEEKEAVKGVIGFVPQDDLLIEDLTVYQNLYYSAKLCLNNLTAEKIKEVVIRTLLDFDLEETRDLRVGNPLKKVISGGQRKRLNIALELLREPTILFVDEPTSGLSSVDSEMVMNLLKAQAYKGKLVVVNIHQPSSEIYKMFDKIMIIDKGGFQVFYGNPNEAIVYFKERTSHANPEEDQCVKCGNIDTDQLLQIIEAKVIDEHGRPTRIRKVSPVEWADKFRVYSGSQGERKCLEKQPLPKNNFSIPGLFKQAGIFFSRDFLSKLYNKQFLLISLLGPPLLASLLAYFTRHTTDGIYIFEENDNIPAFLFMCVITSLFFGLMISSEEIVRDRKLLKRESFLNLSWLSYLNSKILMMFIISAVQTVCFAFIGSAILGIEGLSFNFWLVLFTISCVGNIIGLNISSAFNSVITIYVLIPFIIIPQLLFSGVLVPFEKLNKGRYSTTEFVPVIGDMMPGRWAFEAIAVKQLRDNDYGKNFYSDNLDWHRYNTRVNLSNRLKEDLWFCYRSKNENEKYGNIPEVLNRYVGQLAAEAGKVPGPWIRDLASGKIDSAVYRNADSFIEDTLKGYFSSRRSEAQKRLDHTSDRLRKTMGDSMYNALRLDHNNRNLVEMILKSGAMKTTFERGDKIIPISDPGFTEATSNYGRAHFYAPVKKIGQSKIDTYKFDLAVLWFLTIVLYILLYFKVLARLMDGFENLRFQKPEV
jgi:ABC-type multidrug transport system ATPase subunit